MDNSNSINAAICNLCLQFVWSSHVHDFKCCDCGNIAVDGGLEYRKRSFEKADTWTEVYNTGQIKDLVLVGKNNKFYLVAPLK